MLKFREEWVLRGELWGKKSEKWRVENEE